MYNRYVRNDEGAYRRIHPEEHRTPPKHTPECEQPNDPYRTSAHPKGLDGILSGILGRFGEFDTGDLLLLVLIFLLFRDGEDEELLIALGLLLIL